MVVDVQADRPKFKGLPATSLGSDDERCGSRCVGSIAPVSKSPFVSLRGEEHPELIRKVDPPTITQMVNTVLVNMLLS